jgi:hypothetical protein
VTPTRIAIALLLPALAAAQEDPAAPSIDCPVVAAIGTQTAQLGIPRFGRYSIRVESAEGTAVQLVDRMAGPGVVDGVAGERDGRLDLFLERGEYRIVTHGHERARGEARLDAKAFAAASDEEPRRLIEHRLVRGELRDLEQLSWWLEVGERRTVVLEAAGRSLADLRLWRDGQWLVDATPETRVVQPSAGRPLLVCQLAAPLEPGLYLVTAYGGPAQPWAQGDDEHPLYLRGGIPRLGAAGRQRHEVSPFGHDRFRTPGAATYYRIELDEARPTSLSVGPFDPDRPFAAEGEETTIEKNTTPPVAETRVDPLDEGERVLVVTGDAGQPYVLQHFEALEVYRFEGEREHWVSTVHSGHAADSVDATGILVELPGPERYVAPLREQTVALGGNRAWRRKVNLLSPLTVYLSVREDGRYAFSSEGAEARFRVEPFALSRPAGYRPPELRGSGETWDLEAGFYVLTAVPGRAGIAALTFRPYGIVDGLLEMVGLGEETAASPVTGSVRFPEVLLKRDHHYTLYLNRQPGVTAGAVVRPLPLDLGEPLPLWIRPGEEVAVPFAQSEAGVLRAIAEDGSALPVSLDGATWAELAPVAPGRHTARVRVDGDVTRACSLAFEPARLDPDAPLPPVPDATLAALPDFPALEGASTLHFDLPRGARSTFLVRAAEPGLYRLETRGILATEGNLRTRTTTSLVRGSQNGVGRNFLIQDYLREGDYQLTVSSAGSSAGHLGLSLSRSALGRGGFLTLYRPARASLAPGEAVEYRFIITEPGEFRVRALGQGRALRCRLEDREGWPLVTPNVEADVSRWFDPGHYRFVVLPEATEARVVSLIEPVPQPRVYEGRGPHRLPLGRARQAVWREPAPGQERAPQVWTFEAPADMDARVGMSGEMRGALVDVETGREIAAVPPLRGFQGRIPKGAYRLEVVSSRIDSGAAYSVGVWPAPLVSGLDREVTAPVALPVAVGDAGLVELFSFGGQDVRARLYDAAGRLLASSDDRADDWNFHLARGLSPGEYSLQVDPVGAEQAATRISMRTPPVVEEAPMAVPGSLEASLGDAAHVHPLILPEGESLLLASARTAEGIGLALEVDAGAGQWRSLGIDDGRETRLEAPISPGPTTRYRLRLWSLDRRDSPVRLEVAAVAPAPHSEEALATGLVPAGVEELSSPRAVAAVALRRPGVFAVEPGDGLRWCAAVDEPCASADRVVAATRGQLWIVADRPAATARARRLVLQADVPAPPVRVGAEPVRFDLAETRGGPVLLRATSRTGRPGVRYLPEGEGALPSGGGMAVGDAAAAAVALDPAAGAALVWRAAGGDPAIETRVVAIPFDEPEGGGPLAGTLAPRSARRIDLPGGPKRVRLALDAGLAAVLSDGARVESLHWADAGPLAESVETSASRLTLLHGGDGSGHYSVETLPLREGARGALAAGAPFEAREDRAGAWRLPVAAPSRSVTLRVRGASGESTLVTSGGLVRRGRDLALGAGESGWLLLPHSPGPLLAWQDDGGGAPWATQDSPPLDVEPPASVALAGPSTSLRVRLAEPAVLHVRAGGALVSRLVRAEADDVVEVHPEGARIDAYLPDGNATLTLRAVGAALAGVAELTASPVTPVSEGLGPELLLAPGGTRFFSFEVREQGPVGVGVRASSGDVEATLLAVDGRLLGRGAAQMPTLEPGTYLLALAAPAGSGPVLVQPALVGLRRPDTGPPEEVVRSYLERFRELDETGRTSGAE